MSERKRYRDRSDSRGDDSFEEFTSEDFTIKTNTSFRHFGKMKNNYVESVMMEGRKERKKKAKNQEQKMEQKKE